MPTHIKGMTSADYHRQYRRNRIANGVCPNCGRPNKDETICCSRCRVTLSRKEKQRKARRYDRQSITQG